jgi:hypothetical protein
MAGSLDEADRTFQSEQVCELVGLPYRTLDYWVRTGLVFATVDAEGSGSQRLFSEDDVRLIRLVTKIRKMGFELKAIRHALKIGWALWSDDVMDELMTLFPPALIHPDGSLGVVVFEPMPDFPPDS